MQKVMKRHWFLNIGFQNTLFLQCPFPKTNKRHWFLLGLAGQPNKNQALLTTFRQKLLKGIGFYWGWPANPIKTKLF